MAKFVLDMPGSSKAACSSSLTAAYTWPNIIMCMSGSCGDWYLIGNLFWGYKKWYSGAKIVCAHCVQMSSTPCLKLCHGARLMEENWRNFLPPSLRS